MYADDLFVGCKRKVQNLIDVNSYHVAMTAKVFLPMIKHRQSAFIVNSSACSLVPLPRCCTYSASKAFTTYLTLGIS